MVRRNPAFKLSLPTFATPVASTSKGELTTSHPNPVKQSSGKRLQDQCDILDRLADGEALAKDEWDGVIEKCFVCDKIMLEAVFKKHSRDCWHLSDDELEIEADSDKWGEY